MICLGTFLASHFVISNFPFIRTELIYVVNTKKSITIQELYQELI